MKLDGEQQAPPHPMDEAESAVGDNLPLLPKMRILDARPATRPTKWLS